MATETFQNVLRLIQTSGLNYKMNISPFSATIFIKNSLLKDKNGNPLISPLVNDIQIKSENDELARIIRNQENVIASRQAKLENALSDCENIYETKKPP